MYISEFHEPIYHTNVTGPTHQCLTPVDTITNHIRANSDLDPQPVIATVAYHNKNSSVNSSNSSNNNNHSNTNINNSANSALAMSQLGSVYATKRRRRNGKR